jgi:hypothetical protein
MFAHSIDLHNLIDIQYLMLKYSRFFSYQQQIFNEIVLSGDKSTKCCGTTQESVMNARGGNCLFHDVVNQT